MILYHANCFDGFCAAWIAHKVLPDEEYIPVQYGQDAPDCTGKNVWIVDFSYKRPVMERIIEQCNKLILLDHHKSAQDELENLSLPNNKLVKIIFDMNKSGGRLAWEYFIGNDGPVPTQTPWLVNYTEDRDLWRWKLPDSKAINAALRSYPMEFKLWDGFEKLYPYKLVPEGEAILRVEEQIVNQHVKHGREIELNGFKGLFVNATTLFSEIAGKLSEGRDFGACYFDRSDGKRQWSIRGPKALEVAKAYGGGGHPLAAGFEEDLNVRSIISSPSGLSGRESC